MNKLEKAITQTLSDDQYMKAMYSSQDPAISIEQISKMTEKPLLSEEKLLAKKIVYQGSDQEGLVNQLRGIRTALKKIKGHNLTLITSIDEKSGVSFFAKNLAAVTAFDSSKSSLLIDCNLDSPSVSENFDLQDQKGLMDFITNSKVTETDVIHPVGIKRYRCIPAGFSRANYEEHFTHPRFRSLINGLKKRYTDRSIYMDAPPILKSADTRILIDLCDQVLIVVPFGKVSEKKLASVSELIPSGKLAGVILNKYI